MTKLWGLKNRSDITRAKARGTFAKWSKEHDPQHREWSWEGEGNQCRYFVVDS